MSHSTRTATVANSTGNINTTSAVTTATTTGSNTIVNSNNSKVKILFLGCMNDVNCVQQSIIKIQQLHSTQKVFDIAFTSVTSDTALQYLQQVYRNNNNRNSNLVVNTSISMPIQLPVLYLQDTNATTSYIAKERNRQHTLSLILNNNSNCISNHVSSEEVNPATPNTNTNTNAAINHPPGDFYMLEPNLYVLRPNLDKDKNHNNHVSEDDPQSGIWNIPVPNSTNDNPNNYIVVASIPPYYRTKDITNTNDSQNLSTTIHHPSYIGCDVLLSTEWPQGMESIYQQHQPIFLATNNNKTQDHRTEHDHPTSKVSLWTSYDVADVALRSRPRYHIAFQQPPPPPPPPLQPTVPKNTIASAVAEGNAETSSVPSLPLSLQYYQSPPFLHLTSTVSTRQSIHHTGRFIAVCPVPSTTTTSTTPQMAKLQKFLHAISIVPLHTMNSTSESNAAVLPNPYTDVVYPVDDRRTTGSRSTSTASMTPNKNVGLSEASARRIIAESNQQMMTQTDQFRWSVGNNKRPRSTETAASQEVDVNNCTLFLYGLQQDQTGQLQMAVRNNIPNEPNILLQAFHDFSIKRVRYPRRVDPQLPVSSNYAFLDFPSHGHALKCLQQFQTSGIEIMGIRLTLKWATPPRVITDGSGEKGPSLPESKKQNTGLVKRFMEQEAQDSSTLYFKYTNWSEGFEPIGRKRNSKFTTAEADEEVSTDIQVNMQNQQPQQPQQHDKDKQVLRKVPKISIAGEVLRQWMEETLENALADGDNTKIEERIRAADEPALQVELHLPKDAASKIDQNAPFCFFHFASHAAASMAIATLTGSTDGGCILENQKASRLQQLQLQQQQQQPREQLESTSTPSTQNEEEPSSQDGREQSQSTEEPNSPDDTLSLFTPNIGMYLHWTSDYVQPTLPSDERDLIISEESGFKFARKHFPPDSRTDCWFCLASSSCEKHLITGVYDTCYMTLPKGPVHPGHVLIVPVQHTSQGALRDASVTAEMEDLKMKLRQHASIAYNSDLFVFERAIQTRGGYHTHVQCIPIPRTLGLKLQSVLLAQGRKYGLEIREINSDLGLNAILNTNDDDDDDDVTYEGGYFYAEVPMLGRDSKRLIHKVKTSTPTLSGRDRSGVNMQFGREVLALVLEDPNIAHWKTCLVDTEQEAAMAAQFRESFEKTSNFLH